MDQAIKMVSDPTKAVEKIRKGIDEMTGAVDSVIKFETKVTELLDQVSQKVDRLRYSKANHTVVLRKIYRDLSSTDATAQLYTKVVEDVCWHGTRKKRIKQIKEGLKSDKKNLDPLNDYIDQITRCLSRTSEFYECFDKCCKDLIKAASKEARKCSEDAISAKKWKKGTKVAGGIASATAIGTGVAASIVAGVFTFGIGTVIGLGVTAVGATTAGVGGAVATVKAAKSYQELEDLLLEMEKYFVQVEDNASKAKKLLENVNTAEIMHIRVLLSDVVNSKEHHMTILSVVDSLELLYERIKDLHQVQKKTSDKLIALASKW